MAKRCEQGFEDALIGLTGKVWRRTKVEERSQEDDFSIWGSDNIGLKYKNFEGKCGTLSVIPDGDLRGPAGVSRKTQGLGGGRWQADVSTAQLEYRSNYLG